MISLNQGQNAFALIRKCWHDQVLPVLTERVEGNGRMGGVERERERERASEQQVCRNGPPSCKNNHSGPAAFHQTKLHQSHFTCIFHFFLYHVHCFTWLKLEVKGSNFSVTAEGGPQQSCWSVECLVNARHERSKLYR